MKKIALLVFSLIFITPSFCQKMKEFEMVDSVVIKSKYPKSKCVDIAFVDKQLVVRFMSYYDSANLKIEIVENSGRSAEFATQDFTFYAGCAELTKTANGYRLIKYTGENKINDFNFFTNKIEEHGIVVDYDDYIIFPSKKAFFKSSSASFNNKTYFFKDEGNVYVKNSKTISSSIQKAFKNEKIILEYDELSHKPARLFGDYPEEYKNSDLYYINRGVSFIGDSINQKFYLSFQGSHNIYMYDLVTNEKKSLFLKGMMMNGRLMKNDIVERNILVNKDYYNLFLDSYWDILLYGDKLFRVYKTHFLEAELIGIKKNTNPNSCASPKVILNWNEFQLNKQSWLQEISLKKRETVEYKFPSNVNTFIGYDEIKGQYYFYKQSLTNPKLNQGEAVIYIYTTKVNGEK
jgi:hypothetical protein